MAITNTIIIMNLFKKLKSKIEAGRVKRRLNALKKEAEFQRELTGKQHFVVPKVINGKRDFGLMNNDTHKLYNKAAKKLKLPHITYPELLKMAIYKTKGGSL